MGGPLFDQSIYANFEFLKGNCANCTLQDVQFKRWFDVQGRIYAMSDRQILFINPAIK